MDRLSEGVFVLAFDFGGTKALVGVGDGTGALLRTSRLRVADFSNPDRMVDHAIAEGRRLSSDLALSAVGVSTMGITRREDVVLAPNVPGWADIRLMEKFERAFSVPIAIENDIKAALVAERLWGALQPYPDSAYLNLGTGIGLAFSLGGSVWRGAHGAAGEIAYSWRPGELGYAHGHAPLEERVGGGALDRAVQRQFSPCGSVRELFHTLDHYAGARLWLTEVFLDIAWAVGQMLLSVDVEAVAVGGGISQQFAFFSPLFEAQWGTYLPFAPLLIPSAFRQRAGLYGGLAVGWRAVCDLDR